MIFIIKQITTFEIHFSQYQLHFHTGWIIVLTLIFNYINTFYIQFLNVYCQFEVIYYLTDT